MHEQVMLVHVHEEYQCSRKTVLIVSMINVKLALNIEE